MITILQPGPLSTVQDLGRSGFRKIGVGIAGAMDALAARIANLMVGNEEGAAVLEATMGGLVIRFESATRFALAGADCDATLDGAPVQNWWTQEAAAGSTLRLSAPRRGMRTYVAVLGGLECQPVMGSRSTDIKGGFGGVEGRALRNGDTLAFCGARGTPAGGRASFGIAAAKLGLLAPERSETTELRFVPAAEWEELTDEARELFTSEDWRVQPDSNRVGFRLAGPRLSLTRPREMLSHGVLPGTIQLPPSGQPIVQTADANTCGGYPKIGAVISVDRQRLAQVPLGSSVRFTVSSESEALSALRSTEDMIRRISMHIELLRREAA
jgi:5-oxoprolinase (ATP-hydrolysing) subunit C